MGEWAEQTPSYIILDNLNYTLVEPSTYWQVSILLLKTAEMPSECLESILHSNIWGISVCKAKVN